MTTLKSFLTLILVTFIQGVNGQVISSETIKKDVTTFMTDSSSPDYWLTLKTVLELDESKLTDQQYYLLYYGQSVKPEKLYPSLMLNADRLKLIDLTNRKKFKKAIPLGESLIKINPLDISTLIYLSMSIDLSSGDKDNKYYQRMKKLITVMLKTGDGKTSKTAIKIANIEDDTAIIGFTGFQGTSKQGEQIDGKHYSVWTNRFGDKFYFEYIPIFL